MNAAFRFVTILFLLSMEADALVHQQHLEHRSSIERHHQREENESDAATTDFLAQVTRAIDDQTVNFSTLAALVDVLVTIASSSNESLLDSNWTSMIDRLVDEKQAASTDDDMSGRTFTPLPELSSESDESNASFSVDQVVGSTFSASGDLENTIGDANMADGPNVPMNLATMQLPSGIAMAIVALHTLVLIFKMTN